MKNIAVVFIINILFVLCIPECEASDPAEEQIKADLTVKLMKNVFIDGQRFESIPKFLKLQIDSKKKLKRTNEYEVKMQLQSKQKNYRAKVLMLYKHEKGKDDVCVKSLPKKYRYQN